MRRRSFLSAVACAPAMSLAEEADDDLVTVVESWKIPAEDHGRKYEVRLTMHPMAEGTYTFLQDGRVTTIHPGESVIWYSEGPPP